MPFEAVPARTQSGAETPSDLGNSQWSCRESNLSVLDVSSQVSGNFAQSKVLESARSDLGQQRTLLTASTAEQNANKTRRALLTLPGPGWSCLPAAFAKANRPPGPGLEGWSI